MPCHWLLSSHSFLRRWQHCITALRSSNRPFRLCCEQLKRAGTGDQRVRERLFMGSYETIALHLCRCLVLCNVSCTFRTAHDNALLPVYFRVLTVHMSARLVSSCFIVYHSSAIAVQHCHFCNDEKEREETRAQKSRDKTNEEKRREEKR